MRALRGIQYSYHRILNFESYNFMGVPKNHIELRRFVEFQKKNTKIIVSYHDFEKTPGELEKIYDEIAGTDADIIKIATRENSETNVDRMIRLLTNSKRDMIGICMGKSGKRTRLHTANYLTFAVLNRKKQSAPGQFTVYETKKALQKAAT